MLRKYSIELKINFDDDNRHKIALHMMRRLARQALTQAAMISDGREPQVAFTSGDFFEGGTQESLAELAPMDAQDVPEADRADSE